MLSHLIHLNGVSYALDFAVTHTALFDDLDGDLSLRALVDALNYKRFVLSRIQNLVILIPNLIIKNMIILIAFIITVIMVFAKLEVIIEATMD